MIKLAQFKREAKEQKLKVGINAYATLSSSVEALAERAIWEAKKDRSLTVRPKHIALAKKHIAAVWSEEAMPPEKKKKG